MATAARHARERSLAAPATSLTAAGEQFLRYAPTLVQVWERARHQVAVPAGRRAVLTVGCEVSLLDPLLLFRFYFIYNKNFIQFY